jgi:hypothetical protein
MFLHEFLSVHGGHEVHGCRPTCGGAFFEQEAGQSPHHAVGRVLSTCRNTRNTLSLTGWRCYLEARAEPRLVSSSE